MHKKKRRKKYYGSKDASSVETRRYCYNALFNILFIYIHSRVIRLYKVGIVRFYFPFFLLLSNISLLGGSPSDMSTQWRPRSSSVCEIWKLCTESDDPPFDERFFLLLLLRVFRYVTRFLYARCERSEKKNCNLIKNERHRQRFIPTPHRRDRDFEDLDSDM